MFEVKRSEGLKVKIYDTVYDLKKPTVKMIKDYSIDLESASVGEKFERAKTLLEGMGLGADITDEMEFDHLQGLVEYLTKAMTDSAKKN